MRLVLESTEGSFASIPTGQAYCSTRWVYESQEASLESYYLAALEHSEQGQGSLEHFLKTLSFFARAVPSADFWGKPLVLLATLGRLESLQRRPSAGEEMAGDPKRLAMLFDVWIFWARIRRVSSRLEAA